MKTKLIKKLRQEVESKYMIKRWRDVYKIFTSPTTMLVENFKTYEDAENYLWEEWHRAAERYLWEHRLDRRRNVSKVF